MVATGKDEGFRDAPWGKYYATFAPTFLAFSLFCGGLAALWSPLPAAMLWLVATGLFAWIALKFERKRRRLIAEEAWGGGDPKSLADFQEFTTGERRWRPWIGAWMALVTVMVFAIVPITTGVALFMAGWVILLLEELLVLPWLLGDIESRMAAGVDASRS